MKYKFLVQSTILTLTIFTVFTANAQDWKIEKKINILFGLSQPLVASGFNIEANYIHNRLIFDYSHGVSLDFKNSLVTNELEKQHVAVYVPWTTGFGIGYRLKEWINIRIEPKWHRFEFYYDGESQNNNTEITSYNTVSLGIGVYGNYQPFKKKTNFLKGIVIAPSIRYWPTVNSTLKDNKFTYQNKITGETAEIVTLDSGIGFTPLVINISIGYTFQFKNRK